MDFKLGCEGGNHPSFHVTKTKNTKHSKKNKKIKVTRSSIENEFDILQKVSLLLENLKLGQITSIEEVTQGKYGVECCIQVSEHINVIVKVYNTAERLYRTLLPSLKDDFRYKKTKTIKPKKVVEAWVRKEYRDLKKMYRMGFNVPQPLICRGNILIIRNEDKFKTKSHQERKHVLNSLFLVLSVVWSLVFYYLIMIY